MPEYMVSWNVEISDGQAVNLAVIKLIITRVMVIFVVAIIMPRVYLFNVKYHRSWLEVKPRVKPYNRNILHRWAKSLIIIIIRMIILGVIICFGSRGSQVRILVSRHWESRSYSKVAPFFVVYSCMIEMVVGVILCQLRCQPYNDE